VASDFADLTNEDRVRRGLGMAVEGLALAEREPATSPWVAVGLVLALKGSLVAALSGYDTARGSDIMQRHNRERIAEPIALLVRASQSKLLNLPERLVLKPKQRDQIQRLIRTRNRLLHGAGSVRSASPEDVNATLSAIAHLICDAPSFPESVAPLNISRAKVLIATLQDRFRPPA
jgi:hypothetical protein